jgi:hypothetical protein
MSDPDARAPDAPAADAAGAAGAGTAGAADAAARPAFYAARHAGRWRDWWTILHPPYTAWHLSYVVLGAAVAPHLDGLRLVATLLAFFLAVGVSAHSLDELHGRPLRTQLSDRVLWTTALLSLAGAMALGVLGLTRVGPGLLAFIAIGPVLVVGYNLEIFGGRLHTDAGFALAWGAFPALTGYYAQAESLSLAGLAAAAAAFGFSYAQRALSTPARTLRRRVVDVEGSVRMADGSVRPIDRAVLLRPLERALKTLSWTMVVLVVALVLARVA